MKTSELITELNKTLENGDLDVDVMVFTGKDAEGVHRVSGSDKIRVGIGYINDKNNGLKVSPRVSIMCDECKITKITN